MNTNFTEAIREASLDALKKWESNYAADQKITSQRLAAVRKEIKRRKKAITY